MTGKTVSHYKIIEKLGEGGMGVVYKAEDIKLKRTVALKFLPPKLIRDTEVKLRFIREAQAASALDHPNICNIHEIDETDDGQLFIVMACYGKETLKDRIEAGTFMAAAAITAGELQINNCRLDDMMAVVDKLREIGVTIEKAGDGCVVSRKGAIKTAEITTQPYPGFPTDLQAQFMALLAIGQGNSVIIEKIFPDRFMHVAELNRMGAQLRKEGPIVIAAGVEKLIAAPVMASDLRASAAMVLAAMAAEGTTTINRVYHIDRGYEKIEERLNPVGGKIVRENI